MGILEKMCSEHTWDEFLQYRIEHRNMSGEEQRRLEEYIREKRYIPILDAVMGKNYDPPIPLKKEINKGGTKKKRTVYLFPEDFNFFLKMIAYLLYQYDDRFHENCYAFRKNYGVKNAIRRIRCTSELSSQYCLKVDIHNYFNSIDVEKLLKKLDFLQADEPALFSLFSELLREERTIVAVDKIEDSSRIDEEIQQIIFGKENVTGRIVYENRGAMAGIPVSPFFANVYLMDVDDYFDRKNVNYFRYSDDILILCDTEKELENNRVELFQKIEELGLALNPAKTYCGRVSDGCDFLGFRFDGSGEIDLSEHTKQKMKKKIKRKAKALRRWSEKKNLPYEKAAKGFIRAMNRKFFDGGGEDDFSWSRFYFPLLTTDQSLRELDHCFQEYIRYCVTGRHYKGNYRISYEQLKAWGYRNLLHEYYAGKTVGDQ